MLSDLKKIDGILQKHMKSNADEPLKHDNNFYYFEIFWDMHSFVAKKMMTSSSADTIFIGADFVLLC